jgi:Protein of unknown function (DUF3309)
VSPLLLVLIVLILIFGLGGNFYNGGAWRGPGFGLGGLVLVVLVVLLLMGRL